MLFSFELPVALVISYDTTVLLSDITEHHAGRA